MKKTIFLIFLISSLLFSCQKKPKIKPLQGPITESVYAIGVVRSDRIFELKLGVLSSIKKVFVKEGDNVKLGQRLLVIDSGASFSAPFEGVVTYIPYSVGETVGTQMSLLTLVDLKKLYLEASLEQQGALKVKKGQLVQISFESFRSRVFKGVVKSVLPRNQEFVLQIDVADLPENILPGMNADLSIEIMKKEKSTLVPIKAISNGHLLIKRDGENQKVKVEVGVVDAEYAEILSPELKESDEIILPKNN